MRIAAAMILAMLTPPALAMPAPRTSHAGEASAAPKCDRFGRPQQAVVRGQSGPRAQRLDQLPSGDLQLAVDRRIDGCHQPTIVRQNFGGAAFRPR